MDRKEIFVNLCLSFKKSFDFILSYIIFYHFYTTLSSFYNFIFVFLLLSLLVPQSHGTLRNDLQYYLQILIIIHKFPTSFYIKLE